MCTCTKTTQLTTKKHQILTKVKEQDQTKSTKTDQQIIKSTINKYNVHVRQLRTKHMKKIEII